MRLTAGDALAGRYRIIPFRVRNLVNAIVTLLNYATWSVLAAEPAKSLRLLARIYYETCPLFSLRFESLVEFRISMEKNCDDAFSVS